MKIEEWLDKNQVKMEDFWLNQRTWSRVGLSEKQVSSLTNFQHKFSLTGYFDYLAKIGVRVIVSGDKNYPILLNNIDDPPIVLYSKGQFLAQNVPSISVVGTRKVTPYGRQVTGKIVGDLVKQGAMIVSGFMYGVDFLAHQAALGGGGSTVGVLGFGFEHFYPSVYKKVYLEMLSRGMCFISEYAPFVRPTQGSFPERNRIVAGLSLGTVVIEAGPNSGTLITARLAGEFGRGVFAVPGSIFSPYSVGTKALINQGACLVSSGEEILNELGIATTPDIFTNLGEKVSSVAGEILEELKLGHADFEHLARVSKLPTSELNSILAQLEISGVIARRGEVWNLRL